MSTTSRHAVTLRTPVQIAALVVGVIFLLAGVAGFVPGITTDYDAMAWAGHHSHAQLLGLFTVSVLHNLVHLAFGIAGAIAAARIGTARWYLLGGGAIYLALWLYGLVTDQSSDANFVPLNTADNWLHLGLGLGMVALGAFLPRRIDNGRYLSDRQPGIIE